MSKFGRKRFAIDRLRRDSIKSQGAALMVVLAFVVLLTAVVVAYFGRSTSQRAVAVGTFGDVAADVTARSAIDSVVVDLRREITAGSAAYLVNGVNYYEPSSPQNIIPQRNSSTILPNLIRTSMSNDTLASPAVASVASNINSANDSAIGGRAVTSGRWNKGCLLPMADTTAANNDTTPISAFVPPDWIYVTPSGPVTTPSTNSVIARYAYAVYDEGGLLDANVTGLPSPSPAGSPVGRKGNISWADPRGLPYNGNSTSTATVSLNAMGQLVGWRNNATMQATPSASWPTWNPITTAGQTAFTNLFLSTNQTFTTPSTTLYSGRTDQMFVSRTELLEFNALQGTSAFDKNTLTCLGTFSRDLNQPTRWLHNASSYPVKQRFGLSDFSNISQQKFGLIPDGASYQWKYVGTASDGTAATSIASLNAGTGDFFQLLQYARTTASGAVPPMAETLAIGAAIIDQYDADTNTTQIQYAAAGSSTPLYAYGMEVSDGSRPVAAPTPPSPYPMWNQPFRNVGELGYAYSTAGSNNTIDFVTSTSRDGPILDLFTYNIAPLRAGQINLNTQNPNTIEAMLKLAWASTTNGSGVSAANARNAALAFVAETRRLPARGRDELPRVIAATGVGSAIGSSDENKEAVARAIGEVATTRTWGLMIDVVAQAGHCPPSASGLADFVIEGEKRYWLHIAIDRFTNQILDQQLEAVYE
jgi:hypothetical protein